MQAVAVINAGVGVSSTRVAADYAHASHSACRTTRTLQMLQGWDWPQQHWWVVMGQAAWNSCRA
jgi:hypothetical protein